MRVVDAAGEDLGKVEVPADGGPEAVTTEGNEHRLDDLVGGVVERALPEESEPDVPGPLRTELQRTGYLKIGGHGIGGKARYVPSERVSAVAGETVRLSVRKDKLAKRKTEGLQASSSGGRENATWSQRKSVSASVSTSTSKTARGSWRLKGRGRGGAARTVTKPGASTARRKPA